MSLRRLCESSIAACALIPFTPAFSASLNDLPPSERATAACMAAAVNSIPEITETRLTVFGEPKRSAFLSYNYRHKDPRLEPAVVFRKIDITAFVEKPRQINRLAFGGLVPPGGSVDDADAGMLRIARLWDRKCGLKSIVVVD